MPFKVTVDYSAVERMFPVLESVAAGKVPSLESIEQLLASPGIKVWLRHGGKNGNLTVELYKEIIRQAAGATAPVGSYLVDHLWNNAKREGEFRRILESFKKTDFAQLCKDASEAANGHLTTPYTGEVEIYLMCATRGSAIVLDNCIALDIADYKDPRTEPLPIGTIYSLLAHEIFHMGRKQYLDSLGVKPEGSWKLVYQLTGFLLEEGAATYLFSEEYIRNDAQAGPLYNASLDKLPEIAAWLDRALVDLSQGNFVEKTNQAEMGKFMNIEGYALGTEICNAIDHFLGRKALISCLEDPSIILEQANLAVKKGWTGIRPFSAAALAAVEKGLRAPAGTN